ncbi:MAG: hypothetical protein ACLFPL_01435 [Candidatus Nanoarchaeia archaeon]
MKNISKITLVIVILSSLMFAGCEGVEDVVEQSEENNMFEMNSSQNNQVNEEPAIPPTGQDVSIPTG